MFVYNNKQSQLFIISNKWEKLENFTSEINKYC